MADQIRKELTDKIATTVRADTEQHWSALEKMLVEVCSTATQCAIQRPIIDVLIALQDRIHNDVVFLSAWYHKNPDLTLHIGCRQLQERYDNALRSYAAEILIILRGLGVEQIQGVSGRFNPQHQRVVDVELTTQPELDGHIAKILRAGFTWNSTILRPEEVIVFKQEHKNHEKKS